MRALSRPAVLIRPRRAASAHLITTGAVFVLLLYTPQARSEEINDGRVGIAIDRMKAFLYARQDQTNGGWDGPNGQHTNGQITGATALVLTALLSAGESIHDPRIARAVDYLQKTHGNGTYAMSLRCHVWASLPDDFADDLHHDAQWLKEAHGQSVFHYFTPWDKGIDHSATQYGNLGLWEYTKRGGKVSKSFWQDAANHFRQTQNADGGWAYNARGTSTASMTTAGLTVLSIAQQQAMRDRSRPQPHVARAINQGLSWLDRHFTDGKNHTADGQDRGQNFYYLYGIERVALANGVTFLNGRDWYKAGAQYILDRQNKNSGGVRDGVVETAFSLGFLARGRVPVWITKLAIPDYAWNNRPNDVFFWNEFLKSETERAMNWQMISIDRAPETWRAAPMAYLSSHEALKLTDQQIRHVNRYIDLGGMVLAVSQEGSQQFVQSALALGRQMYPQLQWRRATAEDALFDAHHRIEDGNLQRIYILENGARILMVVVERDWSIAFQSNTPPGQSSNWRIATNLFTLVTNRGLVDNRLVQVVPSRMERAADRRVEIFRASYAGNWNVEPLLWEQLGIRAFNRAGLEVAHAAIDLEHIGNASPRLVHLSGTENDIRFTTEQLAAIKQYVEGGGTVLIESVGGKSGFARAAEGQLRRVFQFAAEDMPHDHPIFTGKGLAHSFDTRQVEYTRSTVSRIRTDHRPNFRAFYFEGRPGVILSSEDLSLASLNIQHWGILGYKPNSARALMLNLLLYTNKK